MSEKEVFCPEHIKRGSKEYGDWYDSLSSVDQARVWVSWVEENIAFFQSLPDIDQERAIRGIIVGEINGDSVNSLLGATWVATIMESVNDEVLFSLASGLEDSWLKADTIVKKLGHFLPTKCKDAFENLFKEFSPYVNKALSNPKQIDPQEFIDKGKSFILGIERIYENPPDMDKQDAQYAIKVYFKYKNSDLGDN